MTRITCKNCGVQHNSPTPPTRCGICTKYELDVTGKRQEWLSIADHYNQHQPNWHQMEAGISRLSIHPKIAIGQDAYLIETPNGNYLWDCVPLINDQMVTDIKAKGGLKAIAISHPHFYSNVADWSTAFGDIPIYIHQNDHQWIQDPSDNIVLWQGDIAL